MERGMCMKRSGPMGLRFDACRRQVDWEGGIVTLEGAHQAELAA